ncbi:LacI family DNA-binding transcriptional regulator [Victivallis sp. Marseille-Q1083]|uniref:LacI family DNA-binding transcriptional regulator n=1 Tax=Victivallis sp. Marseille-Q1083 TaxID=2717288 RepID=UPI0015895220|nr:LacI family DNA-binding transcriptional regulator [Victivallis sp. Marseille-Q1083]
MAVTIYDIAQRANLSHSAVSMALRGSTRVSEATRLRVRALAEAMGYQPNFFARGLKSADTKIIAAVMPLNAQPSSELVLTIQQQCLASGYHVVWQNLTPELEDQRRIFGLLTQGIFDAALVMMYAYAPLRDLVRKFVDSGKPMVVIGPPHDLPDDSGVMEVCIDGGRAVRSATRLLLEQGHRCIAHVVHTPMTPSEKDSHAAIVETLRAAGVDDWDPEYRFLYSPDGNDLQDGFRCARELIDRRSRITAVECPNDLFGIGFMHAVFAAGLRVPEDISILGSNNLAQADYCQVPLTSIDIKYREAAVLGCRMLQRKLKKPSTRSPGDRIVLSSEVVLRNSIGPVRPQVELAAN